MPDPIPPISILFSGDGYLVIDKPAGVLSHAHHIDKESPILLDLLEEQLGHPVYTVHRLDRMTTGAMLIAGTKEAAALLSEQFRQHRVEKRYVAIVRGHMPAEGVIDLPLPHRTREEDNEATTRYVRLATATVNEPLGRHEEAWFSLVELTLLTGRTHQARRHLRRITHPIVGDKRHGDNDYNRWAWTRFGRYLFLRSAMLSFDRPETGAHITVSAGLTEPWGAMIQELFGDTPANIPTEASVTEAGGHR